jgi:hypothetical protein
MVCPRSNSLEARSLLPLIEELLADPGGDADSLVELA